MISVNLLVSSSLYWLTGTQHHTQDVYVYNNMSARDISARAVVLVW